MIIIVAAMEQEVVSVVKNLKKESSYPFINYQGVIGKKEVSLFISGIGKTNAASALTFAIMKHPHPQAIINIGIAGGFKVNKHQIYIVDQAAYHDVDVTVFNYEKGQIPNFPTWYQSDVKLLNKTSHIAHQRLYTGDLFSTQAFDDVSYLVDMEGAALYQVAHHFNYPILALKIVSDVIGSTEQTDEYQASYIDLPDALAQFLYDVLEVI